MKRYLLIGGAGFIGTHCLERLLKDPYTIITVFDNFSSGRRWHVNSYEFHSQVNVVEGDAKDLEHLKDVMKGHHTVYHFAANADIAKAVSDPSVDFREGTFLTQNILEAMRLTGTSRIIYTSGSGVYGDMKERPVIENFIEKLPISPYGASKLASEALISAYVHMFDFKALIFRFANVIGDRQTHGVAYDFIKRLLNKKTALEILGDGKQTKSYLHIEDVINAITQFENVEHKGLEIFNVATQDTLTVTDIAHMVIDSLGLKDVQINYQGGSRGWRGDIPIVYFNSDKLRELGWCNKYTSRQAMQLAIDALIKDFKSGHFDLDMS